MEQNIARLIGQYFVYYFEIIYLLLLIIFSLILLC